MARRFGTGLRGSWFTLPGCWLLRRLALLERVLGGIEADLGARLILIGGAAADADAADLHLVRGHDRQSAGKCDDAGDLRYAWHHASLEILSVGQLLHKARAASVPRGCDRTLFQGRTQPIVTQNWCLSGRVLFDDSLSWCVTISSYFGIEQGGPHGASAIANEELPMSPPKVLAAIDARAKVDHALPPRAARPIGASRLGVSKSP